MVHGDLPAIFCLLNLLMATSQYPLRHIHDFMASLQGATIFSKVDFIRGYHQTPMAPKDVLKTIIMTPFGPYEFLLHAFWAEKCWPDLSETHGLCAAGS